MHFIFVVLAPVLPQTVHANVHICAWQTHGKKNLFRARELLRGRKQAFLVSKKPNNDRNTALVFRSLFSTLCCIVFGHLVSPHRAQLLG